MTAPIRSKKIRAHANGQLCTLRFQGVCRGGVETTVFAHIRDKHKGLGQKASDMSGVFACFQCHTYLDETWPRISDVITDVVVYQHIIRGLQETWEILVRDGIISVPQDAPKQRKSVKRKPKEQRATIQGRTEWPKGRKLQSRNDLRRVR